MTQKVDPHRLTMRQIYPILLYYFIFYTKLKKLSESIASCVSYLHRGRNE